MKKVLTILLMFVMLGAATLGLTACSKPDIIIQLKWLPQAQFMGYYVADAKGYYKDEGLKVEIRAGGGDVTETAAVNNRSVHVGVTWVSNLITARANGMDLINVAQIYQSSGLVLVSKTAKGLATADDLTAGTVVGNWGFGNEYEVLALLNSKGINKTSMTQLSQQDFTMDQFDDGSIDAASAMTYNELGLVKNNYEGALGYGDAVNVIDMNSNGVAMLEDCMFVKESWAAANEEKLVKFIRASIKGWVYACANPAEAAQIVFEAGSSVSPEHQAYMAAEVAKLVTKNMSGATVSNANIGIMEQAAFEQTLSIMKQYAVLADSAANAALQSMTAASIYDTKYWTAAKSA